MSNTLPVPGGGITLEQIPEILEFYGRDTMLLVGGNLLVAEDEAELFARSRAFAQALV